MAISRQRPRQRGERPLIFGRDPEHAQLADLLEDATAGHGVLVLISGEAGIGKTTLVQDLIHHAEDHGQLILAGSCYDLTTTPPYGPWVEIVRALPEEEDLPPVPDQWRASGEMTGIDSQSALFDLTGDFLAGIATVHPLVILLEDLHWADQASLDLLRYLSRMLTTYPVLLIATYRADEITSEHPLSTLLPSLVREGQVHRLELQRLDRDAVQAIVRHSYRLDSDSETRLLDHLDSLTDGNPFFVHELLYTLEGQQLLIPVAGGWQLGDLSEAAIPSLIQQVIDGRLGQLDPSVRKLLDQAAVIGYDVPLDLLLGLQGQAIDSSDAALQQALDHHLLQLHAARDAVRFSHALVRQVIYDGIPLLQCWSYHRQTGELLASRMRPDPAVVANHFYAAGDARALEWLEQAAEQAQRLFAPASVIEHADHGFDLANRLGLDESLGFYRLRGHARESIGDFEGARSDHETVLERAREAGNQQVEWQALLDLGALWASRDYERTRNYCEEAVERARGFKEGTALAHSLNRLGNWYTNADRASEAVAYHDEALELFDEVGDQRGAANTLELLGTAYYLAGNNAQSFQHRSRAIPLLRANDDWQPLGFALTTIAGVTGSDYTARAVRWYRFPPSFEASPVEALAEASDIAHTGGWKAGEAYAAMYRGGYFSTRGDLRQGTQDLQKSWTIARDIEHALWMNLVQLRLGCLHLDLLNPHQAQSHFERATKISSAISAHAFYRSSVALNAIALSRQNEPERGEQLLSEHFDLNQPPATVARRLICYAHAHVLLAGGHADAALNVLDRMISSIPDRDGDISPFATRLRGEILLALNRLEEVEETLRTASTAATVHACPVIHWRILALQRRLYLATGQIAEAEAAGDAALEIVGDLAREIDDEAVRRSFCDRAHALVPPARPYRADRWSDPTFGLTRREIEVIEAVAEGWTDAETGERLFISTRTVNHHLRSIYTKLDVHNRAAAVRVAMEHDLI